MQTNRILSTVLLSSMLLASSFVTARAQSITNADSSDPLNLGTSWVGGIAAGPADIAVWDHTVQANTTKSPGANLAWNGIQILDPAGLITIAADGNTLTNGTAGIDLSLAAQGLTVGCPLVMGASQTWNVTNGLTLEVDGVISGSSGLTLNNGGNNGGAIILAGANTYTGGTAINSGIAQPNTINAFGTAGVTNKGGMLELAGFPHSGVMPNAMNTAGTSLIDMANINASFVFSGAWSGSGTILVTNDTSSGSTLTFGGASGGNMANFTGSIIVADNASATPSAGTLRFNNGGSQVNTGNSSMSINLGGTAPGSPGSTVILANRDAGTTSIGELTGGPGTAVEGQTSGSGTETWRIGGLNTSVTFAGSFINKSSTAIAALNKVGTGTYTLTGTNTFSGAVTISAGTLQIGDGGADGILGTGPIANSAALVFDRSDAYTVPNAITGSGTVTILAGGTNTYAGTNTASGATIISQGDLVLDPAGLMSCPITVGNAGTLDLSQNTAFTLNQTLSGSGTVTGLVAAVGGSINPGGNGTSGTLTFLSGLNESGGINNQFVLSAPTGTNDLINVVGDLTVSGVNNLTLSKFGGGTIPAGIYPLIAYSGTLSGDAANFSVTAVGVRGVVTNITTTTPPEIAVIISAAARGPTNLTWIGDGGLNNWDGGTSNWVNGANFFSFLAGDSVLFNDAGAANTNVNLTITALPASVTFSNTLPYTIAGSGDISGAITLTKTNSGSLTLLTTNSYTGPTIVGQGVLEVQNLGISGAASAIGAANGNPTNLVFYGSTLRYTGTSTATDRGATLNGSGAIFDVIAGTTLTENGILTGPGALTLTDSGKLTLASVDTYAGGTVISNGVLALGSNNANNNGAGGSGVGPTNNPVTFYGGGLQLYGYGSSQGNNYNTFYNPLVVPAGQTGTLYMFPRGPVNTGGGAGLISSLSGTGTLNLEVNYVRDALSGDWSAFSGSIIVSNVNGSGDEMRINNNFGYANAAIYLNGTLTMDSTLNANATINIGQLGGISTAVIGPGNSSKAAPTWCVGWKNTSDLFAGTIMDDNTSPGGSTSITKVGTGTWYLTGQNTYTGSTIVSNGVLALTNGITGDGSIGSSTNIFINAGSVLDVSGRSDGTMPLNSGQVISGYGMIDGILDTTAGGTVSPGGGINGGTGTLTVTNSINLGGIAWMKLDRAASPNSDRLVSSTAGVINFGGTLLVTNIGPRLQPGDTFTLFNAAQLNNSFTVVLPNYYTWDTSQLAVNGTVKVTAAAPPPAISSVDFSQFANGTITLNATNGIPNGPVTVLTSTNLALPLSAWTPVTSANFDGSGNVSVPVTVDPTQPQSYFLLQAQ